MTPGFQDLHPDGVLVRTRDGRNFVLQEFVVFLAADGTFYELPPGAKSDGASTPPEIWPQFPPFGSYWLDAFLHDTGYQNTLQFLDGKLATLPKEKCDALLFEAMTYSGTHEFTRDAIFEAVKLAGQPAFDDDREGYVKPKPA